MEEAILDFIRSRFRASIGRTVIDRNTPLFTGRIVDSFGVLELIAFLEERFGVEIDPGRHELEEFDTVGKIAALVSRLQTS